MKSLEDVEVGDQLVRVWRGAMLAPARVLLTVMSVTPKRICVGAGTYSKKDGSGVGHSYGRISIPKNGEVDQLKALEAKEREERKTEWRKLAETRSKLKTGRLAKAITLTSGALQLALEECLLEVEAITAAIVQQARGMEEDAVEFQSAAAQLKPYLLNQGVYPMTIGENAKKLECWLRFADILLQLASEQVGGEAREKFKVGDPEEILDVR